jgi:pimeloyl-ACP methyl ester carboxylesterase
MNLVEQSLQIPAGGVALDADLAVPEPKRGVVLFAHGSSRAVSQPTLLIVGARDAMVIELNRKALRKLTGEARLEVIAGASHLFSEPGALEQVARLARDWFIRHLKPASPERRSAGNTPP